MQAGHHQHMREPGGPEHFIQLAAQCAFVPKGGGARHAAHLLAQQARQRAAQFLPQLPRSAGKATCCAAASRYTPPALRARA